MSVRTDTINLQVNINGDKSRAELNNLRKTAADLTIALAGMKKGTQEYADTKKRLGEVNKEMVALKQTIGITALTQKELIQELSRLKSLKGSVQPFTKEFDELQIKIKAVEKRLYEVKVGSEGFQASMSKVTDTVQQFSILVLGGLGLDFIYDLFLKIINISKSFSVQVADIMRVTGMTMSEVMQLNKELSSLDTSTSVEGLRQIAIVAGKLGVAKEDILGFVRATDMLVVALGDELGDADEITTQLGKIINVFDKGDGKVTGEKLTAIGNAIVDLANKGVASGGFIVDFTQRLAGLAKTANIGLDETIGLAAGLEELGQRSESSSTAIIKVISDIGNDVPKFAKAAGMSVEEFSKILREKPAEALIRVSEGMVKGKDSFEEISKSFDTTGESGARVVTVLGSIGGKADFFRQKIADAGNALKDTNEITSAFELKNQTLSATIDKITNEFIKMATGGGTVGFLKVLAEGVLNFIRAIRQIPEWVSRNTMAFTMLAAGIALLNQQYIISALSVAKDTAVKIINAVATKAMALANRIALIAQTALIASQSAYITVSMALTGRITIATAAQRLWNIAVSAGLGPIGLLISAVGLLVLSFNRQSSAAKLATDIANRVSEATVEQKSRITTLSGVVNDGNVSLDNRKKALQALININPQYLSGLTLENMKTAEGKKILDDYIGSLVKKAELEAKQALLREKLMERDRAFNAIRNQSRQLEFQNSSDEELTRLVTNPKAGNEFGKFQQAMSFAGVNDIAGLKNNIRDIQTLQSQISAVVKKNVEVMTTVSNADAQQTQGIIASLQKKIKDLEDALPGLTSKKAIHDNRAMLKKYQDELNALMENSKSRSSQNDYERRRKEFEDLMNKMEAEISTNTISPYEAGMVKLYQSLSERIQQVRKDRENNVISAEEEKNALLKVHEAFFAASRKLYDEFRKKGDLLKTFSPIDPKKWEEDFKKSMDATLSKAPGMVQRLKDWFKRDKQATLELQVSISQEGSKKWLEATRKLLQFQMQEELSNTELTESEKELIREKYRKQFIDAEAKSTDAFINTLQYILDRARDVNAILNNLETSRLNKTLRNAEIEKQKLQKQLNSKLLSQEQYNQKVAQLDEEADKKKRTLQREQAKREKALNLMQTILNGASAISKAATAAPWPFNLAGIIAETIRSGLLVASVASTPLPELARGKWQRSGDKHSDPSGGINAKIERDEAVISADAMTDENTYEVTGTPAQITSALNSKNGGASWAGGAIMKQIDWLSKRPASINPNMPRIMEQGGAFRQAQAPAQSTAQPGITPQQFSELVTEVRGLRADVSSWETQLHAVVSIKEYREKEKVYDAAQKASGFIQ